jgi:DNA repair photolyase
MIEGIQAKTVLSRVKEDPYFGLSFSMNLYRACQHACIYCDSRSVCYQLGELSQIRYKSNAIKLLEKELHGKRIKGTIGFGSMNDPYMPVEEKMELTKSALELLQKYRFPVHLMTKSTLVLRDIDLLKKIGHIYSAVSITITTADDDLARIIEPNAPAPSKRFEALRILSENGIYCGISLMPILPFINDKVQDIKALINFAAESKVKYIIPFMGVTLREGSREYFYKQLDKSFPGMKDKYIKAFGSQYVCNSPNSNELYKTLYGLLEKFNIPKQMKFYAKEKNKQLTLFDI